MRIGFDFDGVIYRFTKAYHSWMNHAHGMSLDLEIEALTWDWFTEWQTRDEFMTCMDQSVDAGHLFWQGDLYEPQIKQNLADLRAAGHTLHGVTNRFSGKLKCAQEATLSWIAEKQLKFDSITFSPDKTVVETDLFIEDNLANYDALDAVGVVSYLINRPYNLQRDARRRVNSVDEFTKLILEGKHDLDRFDYLFTRNSSYSI